MFGRASDHSDAKHCWAVIVASAIFNGMDVEVKASMAGISTPRINFFGWSMFKHRLE